LVLGIGAFGLMLFAHHTVIETFVLGVGATVLIAAAVIGALVVDRPRQGQPKVDLNPIQVEPADTPSAPSEAPVEDHHVFQYDPNAGSLSVTAARPPINLPRTLSVDQALVVQKYLRAGLNLGHCLSFAEQGACYNSEVNRRFAAAELEYVALGFRSMKLQSFYTVGGWGGSFPNDDQPCVQRQPNEEAVLWASKL